MGSVDGTSLGGDSQFIESVPQSKKKAKASVPVPTFSDTKAGQKMSALEQAFAEVAAVPLPSHQLKSSKTATTSGVDSFYFSLVVSIFLSH